MTIAPDPMPEPTKAESKDELQKRTHAEHVSRAVGESAVLCFFVFEGNPVQQFFHSVRVTLFSARARQSNLACWFLGQRNGGRKRASERALLLLQRAPGQGLASGVGSA